MAQVTFDRVSKILGTTKVVSDLNLEIADGEFMVFVGPSGCGKTTALRLIAGLDDVSSGTISIGGQVVNGISPSERDIAMVFQNYALYPHMTVEKNLAFSLRQKKFNNDEIARRVREASELLNLGDLLQRKPRQLSGGQRQRVAVGRAIVRHPRIFLFDEPLSNLDAKLRVEMRAGIIKLWQKLETTFVYVTHDQTEAMTMATRIAVINQGQLQQIDSPVNLYRYPANIFVAGFIGSPAMNFFPGRLQLVNGRWQFDHSGELLLPAVVSARWMHRDPPPAKVILGLRPEDIHDPHYLPSGINITQISAKVEVVEMMGSEAFIHLSTVVGETQNFVARTDSRSTCKAGDLVKVGLNLDNAHLFDATSGLALLPKPAAT